MTGGPSGDLLRVATWWSEYRPKAERNIAWIIDPEDADEAAIAVNRAIDSGASVLALLSVGESAGARALVSEVARVTPAQVRDQPEDMTDLQWMRDVAAIRDARAADNAEGEDPAIAAAAAVFSTARKRATPVIFDGVIAHAGAITIDSFDPAWLPASSSTDPAITIAHDHWKVRPALDLHTRGEDDLAIRAVLAVLDLIEDA